MKYSLKKISLGVATLSLAFTAGTLSVFASSPHAVNIPVSTSSVINTATETGVEKSCDSIHKHITSFQNLLSAAHTLDPEMKKEAAAEVNEYQGTLHLLQNQLQNAQTSAGASSTLTQIQTNTAEVQKVLMKWAIQLGLKQVSKTDEQVEDILQKLTTEKPSATKKASYTTMQEDKKHADDALSQTRNMLDDNNLNSAVQRIQTARSYMKKTIADMHKLVESVR